MRHDEALQVQALHDCKALYNIVKQGVFRFNLGSWWWWLPQHINACNFNQYKFDQAALTHTYTHLNTFPNTGKIKFEKKLD